MSNAKNNQSSATILPLKVNFQINSTERGVDSMVTLQTVISQLDQLFIIFNDHYFDARLTKPVISIQTNGLHRLALGWCTTRKVWKHTVTGDFYYEINLSAEFLYRPIHDICETLLHEMVHLSNLQKDIQDCSRGGTYHNKHFKAEAERSGLTAAYTPRYGWTLTELTDEAKAFIDGLNLNPDDFALTRQTHGMIQLPPTTPNDGISAGDSGTDQSRKPKSSSRKYVCPECGQIVRATKIVNVICGDCQEKMIER